MKLTGSAILISRGMKILQAAPAAFPYRELVHKRPTRASPSGGNVSDLNSALAGDHSAVAGLLVAAESAGGAWNVPRAPGKWSPSQIVEHVALILEESANVAAGAPSKFPKMFFLVRPVVRALVFNRTLKNNVFPKMEAIAAFDPASGSATSSDAGVRLEEALRRFDHACRARAASGERVMSTLFGAVPVADFARFQELHIRHHLLQLSGSE